MDGLRCLVRACQDVKATIKVHASRVSNNDQIRSSALSAPRFCEACQSTGCSHSWVTGVREELGMTFIDRQHQSSSLRESQCFDKRAFRSPSMQLTICSISALHPIPPAAMAPY